MKIENNNLQPLSFRKVGGSHPVDKAGQGDDAAGEVNHRDQADLSESARLLAKARAAADVEPSTENSRLEELRQQIQTGEYKIPVEELARRLAARRSMQG